MGIPSELLQQIANPAGPQNVLAMFAQGQQQALANEELGWKRKRYNALLGAGNKAAVGNYSGAAADAYGAGEFEVGKGFITMDAERKRRAQIEKMLYPENVQGPQLPDNAPPLATATGPLPRNLGKARTLYGLGQEDEAIKTLMQGEPRPASAEEKAAYGVDANAPLYFDGDGKPHMLSDGQDINIDMAGENSFAKEGGKVLAENFGEIYKQGQQAKYMLGDLNALKDISSRIATGQSAEFKRLVGPYAQMLGVEIEGLGDMQAFQAVVSKMIPRMRMPGSGPASDFDAQQFLLSLPQLRNTPEGNALIDETFRALTEMQIYSAQIAGQALSGQITREQAEAALRELPDPYTAWKQATGQGDFGAHLKKKYGLE